MLPPISSQLKPQPQAVQPAQQQDDDLMAKLQQDPTLNLVEALQQQPDAGAQEKEKSNETPNLDNLLENL